MSVISESIEVAMMTSDSTAGAISEREPVS